MLRVNPVVLSVGVVLALGGCAKSGDDVSDEGTRSIAGVVQSDWEVDHAYRVQTAREIVGDGSLDLALEQSGVDNALIHPLAATGKTSDPGGATIDLLITVDTVKNGNGVLVRRNSAGKGTNCFRYTVVNNGATVKVTYAERDCPNVDR
jgi:hypothetical protein